MKKLLLFLIPFLFTITAYSQNGYSSVFLRVTDSATFVNSANTTAKHAANYADIWYSVSSGLFWKWSTVTNTYTMISEGGNFWKNAGTTNVINPIIDGGTGNVVIQGGTAGENFIGIDGTNDQVILQANGTTIVTVGNELFDVVNGGTGGSIHFQSQGGGGADLNMTTDVVISAFDDINLTAGTTTTGRDINLTSSNGHTHITTGTAGTLWTTTGPFNINTDPGTSGDVLQSNGAGAAPTWVAPSGGGGTPGGADTNVQYNDGGAFGGETGFTYAEGTNTLTIDNVTAGTASALTDGATITITGSKHTLTSTQATITWTLSQTGDFQTTDIILNATTTTWTFPAGALCVVDGIASGDNTAILTGVSGDHHVMSIYKNGTDYRIAVKNFGQ